ncbi:MAG: hypothetical protein JWP31_481 [Aeromicrobium sp.]|nr:hypothetical protein [Aeromicrobium sp.]
MTIASPPANWPLVAARERLAVVAARAADVAMSPTVTVAQVERITQPMSGIGVLIDAARTEAERAGLPESDPDAFARVDVCRAATTQALNQLGLALSSANFGKGRQAAREVASFATHIAPALDAALARCTA